MGKEVLCKEQRKGREGEGGRWRKQGERGRRWRREGRKKEKREGGRKRQKEEGKDRRKERRYMSVREKDMTKKIGKNKDNDREIE